MKGLMQVENWKQTISDGKANRIGHWPLRTDSRDWSEFGRHGREEKIRYQDAAIFDGETSFIILPDVPETNGSEPFTLSLEFKVEDETGKLPGGLFSRYDNDSRAGWHLSVLTQAGVTMSQANWRNLQFGWSSGHSTDAWKDRGTPGNSSFISSMCVCDGSLYVGTFDDAADSIGRVYRLAEDGSWDNCGHPDKSNCVASLVEWEGRLYAGSMRYRAGGSHMKGSVNHEPGGRIYRYEGGQTWSLFAELPVKIESGMPAYNPNEPTVFTGSENDSVGAMTVYQNHLIAMSFYPYGIFAFDADGNVKDLGAPGPMGKTRTFTLAPFRGRLYVGCNETAGVYSRTLESPWEFNGIVPYCDQVYSFAVYQNELMMGIWREGRMYQYNGGIEWTDCGLMGEELEVMGVSVFNGQLYAGTLPGGHVYRYKGGTAWELSAKLEEAPSETDYCRVWSMAVYDGELFAGTLPSGKVWSLKNDPMAMDNRSLTDGWHKVTAVYDLVSLSLYLDGELVSTAQIDANSQIQPQSQIPLLIGQGPQCRFSGRIREVELFDAALPPNTGQSVE
ncbi:LamG-like jellyroll fold domain-containing protein [Paenibacillus koleovorans]|uniref:LamG-like jellyroll fold domain-containing protein n=1 Tax=Paenibacillus koleovorans TaxID=121608 RepID=UPI000FDBF3BA|nr:LamG-like jellyroll fold domain-containing protein [Paenibacillus koleovorans]